MFLLRRISTVTRSASRTPLLAAVFVAGLASSSLHAATLGHSRLVSAIGEPLRISIPVTQISAAEADSLRVEPAPLSDWAQAGLKPPVDLATLQARLDDGHAPGTRVIHVWSEHVFTQPIADLLLDVSTTSGVQRYQVSLLAQGGATGLHVPTTAAGGTAPSTGGAADAGGFSEQKSILVRRGDNMFAVARRHAVPGVSVYQMMIALQRANPHAFIHDNVNLVKAGEQLHMPDMAALTALSDREARRIFHEHVVAFNAYRQGRGGDIAADPAAGQAALRSEPGSAAEAAVSNVPESRASGGDRLRLSGDQGTATASGEATGSSAVGDAGTASPAAASSSSAQQGGAGNGALRLAENITSGVSNAAHAATAESATADSEGGAPAVSTRVEGAVQADEATADRSADVGALSSEGAPESGSVAVSSGEAAAGSSQPGSDAATRVPPHVDSASSQASAQAAGGVQTGSSPTSSEHAGPVQADDGSRQDDETALRHAIDDAEERVSLLEENVKKLNQAFQSQGEAAKDVVIEGAQGLRQSLTEVATAVTEATIGDEDFLDGIVESEEPAGAPGQTGADDDAAQGMMQTMTNWIQANLIASIVGFLALAVLIIAWLLRRANRLQSSSTDAITPEMVKEKLDQINLDLNEPSIGDSGSPRS